MYIVQMTYKSGKTIHLRCSKFKVNLDDKRKLKTYDFIIEANKEYPHIMLDCNVEEVESVIYEVEGRF